MTGLLIFAVGTFGFNYIVGHSKISLPFRKLLEPRFKEESVSAVLRMWALSLVECVSCGGFWSGFMYGLLFHPTWAQDFSAFELGLFACGSNFILGMVTGLTNAE